MAKKMLMTKGGARIRLSGILLMCFTSLNFSRLKGRSIIKTKLENCGAVMSFSSVLKWLSLHLCLRSKPDSLISISSVVHFKEEMDNLDKKNSNYETSSIDEDTSEEDSDSETDEEEYECVACEQFFLGEDRMEQHRSIYLHWGYAKYINSKIKN